MSDIDIFSPYGDPRKQAATANRRAEETPHGLTPVQVERMRDRMETFLPKLANSHGRVQDVLGDILPEGATLSPGAGAGYRDAVRRTANMPAGSFGGGISGGTFETPQRPFQPEFDSPDRQSYPVHRILANRYWRLYYKLDHVIGNGIDLYSELPWGHVEFTGDGVDGEVKDIMEYSWDECGMRSILPAATREHFVVGEAAPHLFWDDTKGCWTFCALHNPDQLEVIDAPFIKMDPVVEFIPDQRLQQVLNSNHAMLRQVRESMPKELLVRIMARQNIPLSPVNFTFLPRKLHEYDVRGTSIISRMWRILMYEDCLPRGTRTYTADGTVKNIEDVQEGDVVLNREGAAERVTKVVHKDPQPLRKFYLRGGKSVASTLTHRWPILRDNIQIKLEAQDLQEGDHLMVPRSFAVVKSPYSLELARLGGYYLAEGCLTKTGHLTFTFNESERDTWVQDVLDLLTALDVEAHLYGYKSRKAITVRAHKQTPYLLDLMLWLEEHFGKGSATKRLSTEVMSWPLEWKRAFMVGYLRGDGSCQLRRTAPVCSVSTVSKLLAEQLWLVAAQLGWPISHARVHEHNGSDGCTRLPLHTYNFSGDTADWMAEHVFNVPVHRKNAKVRRHKIDEDFVYYPIKSIEELPPEPVVGITVTGDHSYVANGFATYNSVYNASIATARRHAGPLKVAKLGNPQNGWIPGPEHERKLLELLANAELDVNAWLVYHYAINFELVGTTERVMSIDKHNEVIERVKLIALGISKSFLHGEVTYASAASGLTVFLQRLKALRQHFEAKWLLPKFFLQMAKINKWVKPTQAELDHRVRIRRSNRELIEDARYVVPRLEWDRTLDPSVDGEMINAMQSLQDLGVVFSKNTLYSLVGRDFEDEAKQRVRDYDTEQRIFKDHPELLAPPGGEGMPGGGGGMLPGMPPDAFGEDLAPPAEEGAPLDEGSTAASDREGEPTRPDPFSDRDKIGAWTRADIKDLMQLMEGEEPEDEPWLGAYQNERVQDALRGEDPREIWEALEEYLVDEEFPPRQVKQLDDILKRMNVMPRSASERRRADRAREAQLLEMVEGYGDVDFLSGAG